MLIVERNFFVLALLLGLLFTSSSSAYAAELLDHAQMPKSVRQYSEATGHDLYHRGFYPEAMEVWRLAYEKNSDLGALYILGTIYLDGTVVEKDVEKGLHLLRESALRGEVRAQFEMGAIYDDGIAVDQDKERAVIWYVLAATHSDPGAEFNLADHYDEGDGVVADRVLAFAYYLLAVRHGLPKELLPVVENYSATLRAEQRTAGLAKVDQILEMRARSAVLNLE